jgi:hypothetical protein
MVPAVHSDSVLGLLSRRHHGPYAYLWTAVDQAKWGRAFTGNVSLPYVDSSHAPVKLWRVINVGGNGLYARGNMIERGWGVPINTANFQLHLENHFEWGHQSQSPVLSYTAEKGWAENTCRNWLQSGRWGSEDITLFEIDCQALIRDPCVKL